MHVSYSLDKIFSEKNKGLDAYKFSKKNKNLYEIKKNQTWQEIIITDAVDSFSLRTTKLNERKLSARELIKQGLILVYACKYDQIVVVFIALLLSLLSCMKH